MMRKPNFKTHLLYKWVEELGEECFKPSNGFMLCTLCNKLVTANRRGQLVQHLHSARHMGYEFNNDNLRILPPSDEADSSVDDVVPKEDVKHDAEDDMNFQLELCAALRAAQIPLRVVNNELFNAFLTKYTGRHIPDEQYLRRCYKL